MVRGNKYTFEQVKEKFEEKGYSLLDKKYIDNRTKMHYRCPEHPDKVLKITFKTLLNGSGCKYCGFERSNAFNQKYNMEYAQKVFNDLGYTIISEQYFNSNTPLEYVCEKHPDKINNTSLRKILSGTRCKWCTWKERRGENSAGWKGGVTEIRELLRRNIISWRDEALKEYNYKCDITGENYNNLEIHHIKPFHVIRDETLKEFGFNKKDKISDLTKDQTNEILSSFESRHRNIRGVPIHKDLHKLFHRLYGMNTVEKDYEEFKQRYLGGEFKVASIKKWKERTNQNMKKRKKIEVHYRGGQISLSEASKLTGISINALHERYKRGDRGERLFRPLDTSKKLSDEQIKEIDCLLKSGIKQGDIANKFNVSQASITLIKQKLLEYNNA